jgi:hypothetical protein
MIRSIVVLCAAIIIHSLALANAIAQDTAPGPQAPRSSVRLLPDYKFMVLPGIDAGGVKIFKKLGPAILESFGLHVVNEADSIDKNQVLWRTEQTVNGKAVVCVFTKSQELVVTFPQGVTNFRAKIRNKQDLAEMLLMVLTFEPEHGYPVDPSAIVISPIKK